jgi:hypothetical protein
LGLAGSAQPSQAQNLTNQQLQYQQGLQPLQTQGLSALGSEYGIDVSPGSPGTQGTPASGGAYYQNGAMSTRLPGSGGTPGTPGYAASVSLDPNWNPMSGPGYANFEASQAGQQQAQLRQALARSAANQGAGVNQMGVSPYNARIQQAQGLARGQQQYFGQQEQGRNAALGQITQAGAQAGSHIDSLIQSLAQQNAAQQQKQSSSAGGLLTGLAGLAGPISKLFG